MNSKGGEFTIFQGGPSIHVDDHQRIEEEEARQDQIRRNAELNNELQNAFEDLIEDDDDVNETMNSTRYDQQHSGLMNGDSHRGNFFAKKQTGNIHHPFPLRDDTTRLQNQLAEKCREIESIAEQLTSERKKHISEIAEFEKRLSIAEAEKERALMNRNQTHELLVEHKTKVINMEDENQKLSSRIKALEAENSKLVADNETTNLMLSDVQMKYNMVEKNVMFNADRNTDIIIKQAQERHSAQVTMMQQQIDGIKSKFDDMEHDNKNLEIRCQTLQKARETLMIEKSEVINELSQKLDSAQRQCQELLSRANHAEENRRLKNIVKSLESQTDDMSKSINKLQEKLREQNSELEVMDSIVHECGGNNTSYLEGSKVINRNLHKNSSSNSSTPMSPDDRIKRVKEELFKSLNNVKNKREEIKILEKQLAEKDQEIKQLRTDENRALVDMNRFKDEAIRLENKSKILEKELDKMRLELNQKPDSEKVKQIQNEKILLEKNLQSLKINYEKVNEYNVELMECDEELKAKVQQLEKEIELLKSKPDELGKELQLEREKCNKLTEELNRFQQKCVELIHAADRQTAKHVSQLQNEEKSVNKSTITSSCQKCDEYLTQIEKLKLTCLQMQNSNANYLSELNDMKQELMDAQVAVDNLAGKLNLKESRDQEIEKLQKKAQEFEEYMRTHTRTSSVVSSQSSMGNSSKTTSDMSTETSDLTSSHKQQTETKIRDDMAKIFAAEVKLAENKFREESERWQNKILELSEALGDKNHELEVRNHQLELLKFTILQEREETANMLNQKDEEIKIAIEKYRNEYECHQQKVEDLMIQVNDKKELMDEERISIEKLRQSIQDERAAMTQREDELKKKFKKYQNDTTKALDDLTDKYQSAKRTITTYKQYIEDKDKHYKGEFERIRSGYQETIEKVKSTYSEAIKEKERSHNERLKKTEKEYQFKLEILKGMLEKNQPNRIIS